MINTAHDLQQQRVKVLSLTENATSTVSARSRGVKAALARGRKGGRRRKLTPDDEAVARAMLKDPTIPVAAIAKRLGVSRATFYAYFPGARRHAVISQGTRP